MQRIDTSRAVQTRPTADTGATSPGYFTGGNPELGQLATELSPEWCNAIQESIYRTITAGLVTPAKGAIGDTNLLEAVKNLHKVFGDIQMTGGYAPSAFQTYNLTFTFTPPFPSVVFAASWINSASEQPIQVSPVWSLENNLLINNAVLNGCNTALTSIVIGKASVAANVQCSVVGRIVTQQPPAPYSLVQQGLAYLVFPWGV